MARPRREINWEVVEKLIENGSSGIEIAGKFKIDSDTFYRRFQAEYNCRFADYTAIGSQGGKADLRSMLWAKAINNKAPGNAQLLMFLARCELGMKEPDSVQLLAANQPQIDQTHEIMRLQHRIAELEENADKS
jgi:hypothetical protein